MNMPTNIAQILSLIVIIFFSSSGMAAESATNSTPQQANSPTVVSFENYKDPFIRVNRYIFAFNHKAYRYLLIPLAKGYQKAVPDPAQKSIGNFFYNIKTPIYIFNHVLQANPQGALNNTLRFGINSTVGILGLFDPAAQWFQIEKAETHLEQTISHYGLGYGVYLVLPLLGSSDTRNGFSLIMDYMLNPLNYAGIKGSERVLLYSADYINDFSPLADQYLKIYAKAEDPYLFFRNMYLQGVQRDELYK